MKFSVVDSYGNIFHFNEIQHAVVKAFSRACGCEWCHVCDGETGEILCTVDNVYGTPVCTYCA